MITDNYNDHFFSVFQTMLFNNKYGICFFTERQEPTKDKNSPLAMDERPKQEQLWAIEQEQLG